MSTFAYKLVQHQNTKTFHIIKAPVFNNEVNINAIQLNFNHKTIDRNNLVSVNYFIPQLNFNIFNWENINIIREAAAILANQGYNVCANCVRELYKNDYPDLE
jgi:hypothetical protein